MVDSGILESYLNEKSAKEGDIVEIKGEGNAEDKEDIANQRKYKVLNLPVLMNGRELTYTPNKTAVNLFQKAWGKETKDWVGKKFSIKFYPVTAFGQTKTAIMPVIMEIKK